MSRPVGKQDQIDTTNIAAAASPAGVWLTEDKWTCIAEAWASSQNVPNKRDLQMRMKIKPIGFWRRFFSGGRDRLNWT